MKKIRRPEYFRDKELSGQTETKKIGDHKTSSVRNIKGDPFN